MQRVQGEQSVKSIQDVKSGINEILNQKLNNIKNTRENNIAYLNRQNFEKMGKYHKNVLYMFGRMMDLVKEGQIINYHEFVSIFENMMRNKNDVEKQYIWGLFFPSTIKHASFLNPFPVPVYTFTQNYTFHISPNENGNFVLQMVTPFMVEQSNTSSSDMYYSNDSTLDGYKLTNVSPTRVAEARVPDNIFQAFVLCAASIDVKFVGRQDVSSGYFGASYHLSSTDVNSFDDNVENFNYVDNTIGSIRADLFSGVNMIYFPQDSSFSQFKKPNTSSADNYIAMSHRMNIYGRSLPSSTLSPKSVMVTVTKVYATLPKSGYEDVLSVHTEINEVSHEQMQSVHEFIKTSGFGVRNGNDKQVIDKFLNMLPIEKNEIIEKIKNEIPDNQVSKRRDYIVSLIRNYKTPQTIVSLYN